jgi:hypothetical protein
MSSQATDPYVMSILMQINLKQQGEINRLVAEFVAAGIEPGDAQIIATEQVENMYL